MKPLAVVQGPINSRSGYGDMTRDICRHLIDLDLYDLKLVNMAWGNTPDSGLDATNARDTGILTRILPAPVQLARQPDVFIQISVPNEFQPIGKYNIGITAGIETTAISLPWIQGCNRMNTVWTISEHSKQVITGTLVEEKDANGTVVRQHSVTIPVEVLHNCIDLNVFKKLEAKTILPSVKDAMQSVKEKFNFLFVGHWLKGNMGEDRKNVGLMIKIFCETFKTIPSVNRPALVLKTSGAGFSVIDREECLAKIRMIRESVGVGCPNVYLLHGDLSELEMNSLYNHPKIKAHVSFTKGEGFGRPLLEATQSQKPVIASAWSGHLDFLNPSEAILVGGELRNVEPGAVWADVIIPESQWFNVDVNQAATALMWVYKNTAHYNVLAKKLAVTNAGTFNYEAIRDRTQELLLKYVPAMPTQVAMKLPTLKKIVVAP